MGCDADLAAFDPSGVADAATYENPAGGVKGIPYLIVGGVPVLDQGRLQAVRPGKAVRLGLG